MTPKKKVEPQVEEVEEPVVEEEPVAPVVVVEEVPVAPVEELPQPVVMITCAAQEDFKDGAFKERFAVLGYGVLWKKDEERTIPPNLFKRCRASGAKLQVVVKV